MRLKLLATCLLLCGAARAQAPLDLREAVRLALARSPDIELQRASEGLNQASARSTQAPFDTVTTATLASTRDVRPLRADERARTAAAGVDQDLNANALSLGATRQLESGLQLIGAYTLSKSVDDVQAAQNIPKQSSDRLTFTVRVPLQKNSGRDALAARTAAELDYSAAQRETEQVVARSVLAVVLAYWDWSTRIATAQVAASSEARVQTLKHETEKLVAADELPPAELNLMNAAVTERITARIGFDQRVRDGRTALARLYGMDANETTALMAPQDSPPERAGGANLEALRHQALERRADLAALRLREQGMGERLQAARGNNKPTLDLELGAYYAGLKEGSRANPATYDPTARTAGPGLSARLSFAFPPANSANEAALLAASANLEAARVRRITLERGISTSVEASYISLQALLAQLAASEQSVERYRAALKDVSTRRQLGTATLIDVLNVEDRLNNAVQARLQYQLGYAQARAQILYETGSLLQKAPDGSYSIALAQLLP